MDPFPYFKHPTHPLSTWSEEADTCHFCRTVGPGFNGPFYGPHDFERVCERCLRAGRLGEVDAATCSGNVEVLRLQLADMHSEFDAQRINDLVIERTGALEERTPHLNTWQDLIWPAHCGDYCQFVEELGQPEITELAGTEDPEAWFAEQ